MILTDFEKELFFGWQDKNEYDPGELSQDEINKLLIGINDPIFVHLHVHSDYSIGKSTASVSELIDNAIKLKMTHLALTDSGNMFGIMEFLETIEKRDTSLRPIIGCEVLVTPGSRFENDEQCYHLVLLAENRQGYLNLMKLCSLGYTEGFYKNPRVDNELLEKYNEGLIALSGCMEGEIPTLIRNGELEKAEEKAIFYQNLFGKRNFFLEIQDHGIPEQKELNKIIADISKRTGIPLVATNNVHYTMKEDLDAHDTFLCIGTGKKKNDKDRQKYYGNQYYLKSREEMIALFKDYPEAIKNTVRIAKRCASIVPKFDVKDLPDNLPLYETPELEVSASFLQRFTEEGINYRYAKEKSENGKEWEEIKKRVKYELSVIIKFDLSNYFLIVHDYVNWARQKGIHIGPGRSSGAGSIVAYALGITNIDPLKYNLLFERFINPEKMAFPDFDIDFSEERRFEVIDYVITKYGKDKVSQIITFGTLGAKAALKDVARVLDISISESEKITNLIPALSRKLSLAVKEVPELQELEKNPRYCKLFTLAKKLEGLCRHTSIHAAGLVLSKKPLIDCVPLFLNRDNIATQYDMRYLETCGLIKFDFLSLSTLDMIKKTENLLRERYKQFSDFSIENIPEDDAKTFELFKEGNTDGIFFAQSFEMKEILKQAKPDKFKDLTAIFTLYRPGLMDKVNQFIDTKNGKKEIVYPHPYLEDILEETYGVIIFQEQIIQIINLITGYSLGKADILRRIFSRNKPKDAADIFDEDSTYTLLKSQFICDAIGNGFITDTHINKGCEQVQKIFDTLACVSSSCYLKSHAVAYTKLAYQTAYLKANFPKEWKEASK